MGTSLESRIAALEAVGGPAERRVFLVSFHGGPVRSADVHGELIPRHMDEAEADFTKRATDLALASGKRMSVVWLYSDEVEVTK